MKNFNSSTVFSHQYIGHYIAKMCDVKRRFNNLNYENKELRIYIPPYFQRVILMYFAEKMIFSEQYQALLSDSSIFGVKILDGYENKVVIANAGKEILPDRMKRIEINIDPTQMTVVEV